MEKENGKKYFWWSLFVLLCFGVILRFLYFGVTLSHDEWYTYDIVKRGFVDMHIQMYDDVHTPLYFYILWFFIRIFGESDFLIRLPSLIFAVLGMVSLLLMVKKFFNRNVVFLSTAMMSLSVFHLAYSRVARMYSLMFMLASISLYFIYNAIFNNSKNKSYWGYIITNIALFYTHFYAAFWFLFEITVFVLFRKKIPNIRKLIEAHLIIIIVSMPVFWFGMVQIFRKIYGTSYADWMPETNLSNIYESIMALVANDILVIPFLTFLTFLFFKLINKKLDQDISQKTLILFIGFLFCFVLPSIVTLIVPIFAWRYYIIFYPIFIILISVAVNECFIKRKELFFVASLVIIILYGFSSITYLEKQSLGVINYDSCVEKIRNIAQIHSEEGYLIVSTRWLNEWVPNHKPIEMAHEVLKAKIGVDTILINEYKKDLTKITQANYKKFLNVSPSGQWSIFINTTNLQESKTNFCEGYSYTAYVAKN